jgi:hypothetical protein
VSTVAFTEKDGRTILMQLASKQDRDAVINSGMELGMQGQMDVLEQIAISLR